MKKLICFDMDGTVNITNKLIDGAKETFEFLKENNIMYVFITNNSSKNVETYINKMRNLGIECNIDNFFTSVELTKRHLQNENVKDICLVGTEDFYNEMKKYFNIHKEYKKDSVEKVVVGFDTELNYEKLRVACKYIEDGIEFLATNPDLRCPIEDNRYIPDCGSICEMIRLTTDVVPRYLGKPNGEMIKLLCEKENVSLEDTMVVGDRLYTDILVGINAGCDTVAVLTGETSREEIDSSSYKPTYVLESIKDLPSVLKGEYDE